MLLTEENLRLRRPPDLVARRRDGETERSGSGRWTIECPDVGHSESVYCFTFASFDRSSMFDFLLQTVIVSNPTTGETSQIWTFVPVRDRIVLSIWSAEYELVRKVKSISIWKSEGFNFGVVKVLRMQVKNHYDELVRYTYRSKHRRFYYAVRDGRLVLSGPPETGLTKKDLPPLPPAADFGNSPASRRTLTAADLESRLYQLDEGNARFNDESLYFYEYEPVTDENGQVVDYLVSHRAGDEPGSLFADQAPRLPGGYLDVVNQGGTPPMSMTILSDQDRNPLLCEFCTGYTYEWVREHIFVKKKRTWYGKKKVKITRIFERQHQQGQECSTIVYQPETTA